MEIGKGRESERVPHARILFTVRPSFRPPPRASQGHLLCFGAVSCTEGGGGREREDRPARKMGLRRVRAQGSAVLKAKSAAALSVRVRPFVLPHAYVPRETKWALYITDYSSCSDTYCNKAASDYVFWALSEENTYPVTVTQQAIAALDEIQSAVLS